MRCGPVAPPSSSIRARTVILAGSADRVYGPELFAETARSIPGSRLRVFEGRGPVTAARHPEWSREIERFIAAGDGPVTRL